VIFYGLKLKKFFAIDVDREKDMILVEM